MRPLTKLNGRGKIYSTVVLAVMKDMMQQLVPRQQVGFMKHRHMMSHVARWLRRIVNTQCGAERWFFGADLEKAYRKRAHEFVLAGLAEMRVPLKLVRWVARYLEGLTSILVGSAAVGDPFTLEAGIRQGDPLSPMLFAFAPSFLIRRIHAARPHLEQFLYVDDSVIDIPPREVVLRKVLQLFDEFGHVSNLRCSAQKSELLALEQPTGVVVQGVTVVAQNKVRGCSRRMHVGGGGVCGQHQQNPIQLQENWRSGTAAGSQDPVGTLVGVPDTAECGDSGADVQKGPGIVKEVCQAGDECHLPHGEPGGAEQVHERRGTRTHQPGAVLLVGTYATTGEMLVRAGDIGRK